jgi:uracil permease
MQNNLIYGINDRIPFKQLLLFSIQMMLSVFVATVLIANICGVAVSGALVGAGLSTLIYILCTKGQSPMFLSNSGAFVAPVMMALAAGGHIAVAIGGIITCIIYCIFGAIFTKVPVENIYKIFPRSLIGAVTCVIGINLMPFILTYVQINGVTNMWGIIIALITMFSIAMFSHYSNGMFKILPFLLGTLVGYACAIILTLTNIYPIVDFSMFNNLALFSIPDFAFTHWSAISWETIIPIAVIYIAYTISAMMECLSDHAALGGIIGTDLYKKPGLSRLFSGTGVANAVGSIVGGLGITSYGEGVACVGFSKVASVWVTGGAAIILILLGFLAPVQAFIASIPSCVFAGAAIILYGFIACSGIKMLQNVDLNQQKNLIIVSAVLSLGISGLAIGGTTISISATALALIAGVIFNIILKEGVNNE